MPNKNDSMRAMEPLLKELGDAGYDVSISGEQGGPRDIELAEAREAKAKQALREFATRLADQQEAEGVVRVLEGLRTMQASRRASSMFVNDVDQALAPYQAKLDEGRKA